VNAQSPQNRRYIFKRTDRNNQVKRIITRRDTIGITDPENTVPFYYALDLEAPSAIARSIRGRRPLRQGEDTHGMFAIRRREHDRMIDFAWAIREWFEFLGLGIELPEGVELRRHIARERLELGERVLRIGGQGERHAIIQHLWPALITDAHVLGQHIIRKRGCISGELLVGALARCEPERHLRSRAQVASIGAEFQQSTG